MLHEPTQKCPTRTTNIEGPTTSPSQPHARRAPAKAKAKAKALDPREGLYIYPLPGFEPRHSCPPHKASYALSLIRTTLFNPHRMTMPLDASPFLCSRPPLRKPRGPRARERLGREKNATHARDFPGGHPSQYCARKEDDSKQKGCSTRTSREVTHPSTVLAQARLTAEF